jgi:sugar lactone lactonase YvrE
MGISITHLGETKDRLGEGPLWDTESQRLFWIDSLGGVLHRLDPVSGAREDFAVPAPIGSLALCRSGGAIISLQDAFHRYDFASGEARLVAGLGIDHPDVRLNDGKVDRQGRFLAGTMHGNRQPDEKVLGGLYRLDADGTATLLLEDIATTNGPCFSPDGRILYVADSSRQVIWACDYDTQSGTPSRQRVFADLKPLATAPDGATVDAEGHLWSALVRTGQIGRFDPAGQLVQRIDMPVSYPTSLAFGGPGLDVLYVTSISATLRYVAREPEAGGLFAIEGLGVTGLPEPRFAG